MSVSRALPKSLDPQGRSLAWQAGAVVLGSLALTLSSWLEVPMVPVPVNMQTLALMLVGALYGWRLGAVTILVWLGQAAIGLPVLSGGAAGIHHFFGPTAGYLVAFPIAGAMMGWLAERGWNGARPLLAFAGMLMGNALCLALGAAWLAVLFGAEIAITTGVAPFIVGGILKSALGAALLAALAGSTRRA